MTCIERLGNALAWCGVSAAERKGASFIYVIQCREMFKIGIASNVKTRMASLQTACPYKLTMLASWKTESPLRDERALHHKFRRYRGSGEWFELPADVLCELLSEHKGQA